MLLLGVLRHVTWEVVDQQALVWNLCGAVVISVLLIQRWMDKRGVALGLVVLWFLYEEALVGICSAWRIADWWPVAIGEGQCNLKFGAKLSSISLVLIGLLIVRISLVRARKP